MMMLPGWLTATELDPNTLIVCDSARQGVAHAYRVRVIRAGVETSIRWRTTETSARELFERTAEERTQ